MRLRFLFRLANEVDASAVLDAHDGTSGIELCSESLERFLPERIADAGVAGGVISLERAALKPVLAVSFELAETISPDLVDELKQDVIGQLEDGIGEGGFEASLGISKVYIYADTSAPAEISWEESTNYHQLPSNLVLAARRGDMNGVLEALQTGDRSRIDEQHQGYTALHYSILRGKSQIAKALLDAGANPDRVDVDGQTPLLLCALANKLDDKTSSEVAKCLLEHGADLKRANSHPTPAEEMANIRGKIELASLLSSRH